MVTGSVRTASTATSVTVTPATISTRRGTSVRVRGGGQRRCRAESREATRNVLAELLVCECPPWQTQVELVPGSVCVKK